MPISYFRWQSYPWKNELALQSERVIVHFAEMLLDDFDGEHNPMDMLDRAIVLAAFAMRRMCEKRLVTDKLAGEKIPVKIFERSCPNDFRSPYLGYSGGMAFSNYKFKESRTIYLKINEVANEDHPLISDDVRIWRSNNSGWTPHRLRFQSEGSTSAFHHRGILRNSSAGTG